MDGCGIRTSNVNKDSQCNNNDFAIQQIMIIDRMSEISSFYYHGLLLHANNCSLTRNAGINLLVIFDESLIVLDFLFPDDL